MSGDDIVITGVGVVSPVGGDTDSTLAALRAGGSGVRVLPADAATPNRLHAPVDDAVLTTIGAVERRRLDRGVQFALQAGREAWRDAGTPSVEPERLATVVSTGIGGFQELLRHYESWAKKGPRGVPAYAVPGLMPNSGSSVLAIELGARAGAYSLASACASGADSLAQALRLFRDDEADVVVAGGADAPIHPATLSGFAALRALSSRDDDPAAASRPFDRDRDGFVLGEGAGVLVLERRRHAVARRARIWATLLGSGNSCDAFHQVAPEPTGRGAAFAIDKSLRAADLVRDEVVHISAHGTATPLGDRAEAGAIRGALGASADGIGVSALKASIGHSLGASGAIAAVVAARSLHDRVLPPTRNLDNLDADIDLDVVRDAPRPLHRDGAALVNSFGFGGHNVVVALAA